MNKFLEVGLKSAFVAYIVSAFDFVGGFEMHLNPLEWSQLKLGIFIIFFVLTAIIETLFIKKKK
jgi:hypothetical protein